MRLTYHQCIQCKVPHRACNMVSEIMTQTPDKARKDHKMFFYYLHSTTPIVTKPSKLAATRRLYLQLSVALVRHQSKKKKRTWWQWACRSCPVHHCRQGEAKVPVLSLSSAQGCQTRGCAPERDNLQLIGFLCESGNRKSTLTQARWISHLQVSRSPTIKILMILQCWWAHPILDEPRHKLQHLLLRARSIVPLCSLTHLIENIDQWKIGR